MKIYEYCREMLEYIDPAGEVIHGRGCRPGTVGCTCGLDEVINNIRTEIAVEDADYMMGAGY